MNAHVKVEGEIALQRSLADVVAEYDAKKAAIPNAVKAFEKAGNDLKMAVTVAGQFGDVSIDTGHVYARDLETGLLKSAWKHVYGGLDIERLASPTDKRLWEQAIASPPPFTLDNIRGTFGKFLLDPRGNILRGLAEVFCGLDDAYKSHDKVKVGVKGLPKRVILSNVGSYGSYGRDKLKSVLNALAVYQGKPLIDHREIEALCKNEDALLVDSELPADRTWDKPTPIVGRGVRLRKFGNGNGHLFFEPKELRDINMALAEFYGDVLPDTADDEPKRQQSTAVSKDLQYYPTPIAVVRRIIDDQCHLEGRRVLEPSCGCGRFMDALRKAKAKPYGIEVDPKRAAECKAKGHTVLLANFLETVPTGDFDLVFMNPPFYGKHYAKHVRHAYEFLKPDGKLIAILPATARYDHGLLDDLGIGASYGNRWSDLPVGSFSESGTNINTTVLTIYKR
jgi:hypothetical protein